MAGPASHADFAGPVLLALIFTTYTLQWLAVMGFLPTLLVEEYGLTPGRASVLTAVMVAMNVPGNLLGGWLLHRGFRRWRLIAFASVVMGFCSLGIYSPGTSLCPLPGLSSLFRGRGPSAGLTIWAERPFMPPARSNWPRPTA